MSEKITLTVFKDSPHIWAGGLRGKDLAKWLMGRANAILFAETQKLRLSEATDAFVDLCSSECFRRDYANLGLSQSESGPIRPLSMEAIQFDKVLGGEFHRLLRSSLNLVTPVIPVGFAELSDLHEAQEEFQQKKAVLSQSVAILSGRKAGD